MHTIYKKSKMFLVNIQNLFKSFPPKMLWKMVNKSHHHSNWQPRNKKPSQQKIYIIENKVYSTGAALTPFFQSLCLRRNRLHGAFFFFWFFFIAKTKMEKIRIL